MRAPCLKNCDLQLDSRRCSPSRIYCCLISFQWGTLRLNAILPSSKEYYSCHLDMGTFLLFLMHSLSYTINLFSLFSTSRDLRSHRIGYHCGATYSNGPHTRKGLQDYFVIITEITFRDNPFVKRSARLFSLFT